MTLHVTMNRYQVCKRCCYLNVKNVTEVMEQLGNPFADASTDLHSLETKQIMSERVVKAVSSAEDMWKMCQYQKCVVNHTSSTATVWNNAPYEQIRLIAMFGAIRIASKIHPKSLYQNY